MAWLTFVMLLFNPVHRDDQKRKALGCVNSPPSPQEVRGVRAWDHATFLTNPAVSMWEDLFSIHDS